MKEFIIGIVVGAIGGALGSLILALVPKTRTLLGEFKDLVLRELSSAPTIGKLERLVKDLRFEKFPPGKGRLGYRVRYRTNDEENTEELYPFFTKQEVIIVRFMAFLIPSLDRGHGSHQDLYLSSDWYAYLRKIDDRAPTGVDSNGSPLARRIVFFDKPKLMFLIFHTDLVMKAAQVDEVTKKLKPLETIDLPTESAREIIQYARDVALIHQIIFDGNIACRFVAKSVVAASEYYDFGLYEIDKIKVVYTPIQHKNTHKTLAEEKIYIGNTKPQSLGIADFVSDFEMLWKKAEEICKNQKRRIHDFAEGSLSDPDDDYFQRTHFLTPEFFEEIYCKALKRILLNRLEIDIPKIASLSAGGSSRGAEDIRRGEISAIERKLRG